jgi:hypothetical protein
MTINEAFAGMNKAARESGALQPEGAEIAEDYKRAPQAYTMDRTLHLIAFLLRRVNEQERLISTYITETGG